MRFRAPSAFGVRVAALCARTMQAAKVAFTALSDAQRAEFLKWAQEDCHEPSHIVLRGEKGKKARYNGCLAKVVNTRSGWADVVLQDGEHVHDTVRWHRGWWSTPPPPILPGSAAALSAEELQNVFSYLTLVNLMAAREVCTAWAQAAAAQRCWERCVTPLHARECSAEGLCRALNNAGSSLRYVDLGFEAGRPASASALQDVDSEEWSSPLRALLLRPLESDEYRFPVLNTLILRDDCSWVDDALLATLVPSLPALEHLQLRLPEDAVPDRYIVPSLRSLHLNTADDHHHAHMWSGEALSSAIGSCSHLHTLGLTNGGFERLQVPSMSWPSSLRVLKLCLGGWAMDLIGNKWRLLLHLRMRLLLRIAD